VSANNNPTPEDDPVLRETLKRCSPATYYAACKFRKTGHGDDLQAVILGVVERFVERDLRPKLQLASDKLRLSEDLGIDSLTMMEIVMIAEEVLRISVSNDELTHLRTLGEVQRFIEEKLASPSVPAVAAKSAPHPENWDLRCIGEQLRHLESNGGPVNRVLD
jgi:3-hydroxyacyl-[acyl-carrier-protein] dehydratase